MVNINICTSIMIHDIVCNTRAQNKTIQGRQTGGGGSQPPLNFGRGGVECLSTPLILRGFFLIAHICYYVQVISIGGGGGGLAPLKLI